MLCQKSLSSRPCSAGIRATGQLPAAPVQGQAVLGCPPGARKGRSMATSRGLRSVPCAGEPLSRASMVTCHASSWFAFSSVATLDAYSQTRSVVQDQQDDA